MSQNPDRSQGAKQETGTDEAPPEQAAPQPSQQSPQEKQEFYWRRQAEKVEKELAALRAEREAELNRLSRDRDEAAARAAEAEWRAKRLSLIDEAGLPSELVDLVPEGYPDTVTAYLEKLKPIAEKLARPLPRGLTNTNPSNPAGQDEARLQRLAAEAARGDRRALREYSHLREKLKSNT
ncbi:MAG: hypothetical protein JSV79_02750, partial [Armatimonadota bacterium]